MVHKVFLVEDEIVAREGIRDQVNWTACGFEFCGEAPDGEMAMPLLLATKPDLLITDIRMPFMDGLQLSMIVRERLPWVKIIILSGHDEFEYAQKAIKLGVSEYLLKPLSVQDLHTVLRRVASQLELEKQQQIGLEKLREQAEENRAALRERFLLALVMGTISSSEAIQQGQQLGIDLVARYYLVVVVKVELSTTGEQVNYDAYLRMRQIVSEAIDHNPDVFLLNKGLEELVLIIKGNAPEFLQEEKDFLLQQVARLSLGTTCRLTIGVGDFKERIADIYQSLVEALINTHVHEIDVELHTSIDKTVLLELNKPAVEDFLRCGVKEDFDAFFTELIKTLDEKAFRSHFIRDYILIDVMLTTAKFVNELGGNMDQVIPGLDNIGMVLTGIETLQQVKDQIHHILARALAFRDSQAGSLYAGIIRQARDYIDHHHMDSDLSLNEVASHVSHSASHFSTLFSQETGQTFIDYLTEVRIKRARELLRTTMLRSSEISCQVGYSDPHYFSFVFKKHTGLTPTEFRMQAQTK